MGGEENYNPFHQTTLLSMLDNEGHFLWAKSYLPSFNASGNTSSSVQIGNHLLIEGNYFVPAANSVNLQIFLTKLDALSGTQIWVKGYGDLSISDNANRIISTNDGGFALVGWAFPDRKSVV